uniref:Uncharacterized protein n=1 Tax=Aureoumbra lagunensis TaxID=44058 RepID=A0A7S3NIN0_9STRA
MAAKGDEDETFVAILSSVIDACDEVIDARDCRGDTPLHTAARFGAADCAVVLLQSAASLKCQNLDGKTALDLAPSSKFKLLLETYATPIKKIEDHTPIHNTPKEPPKIVSPPSTSSSSASTTFLPREENHQSPTPKKKIHFKKPQSFFIYPFICVFILLGTSMAAYIFSWRRYAEIQKLQHSINYSIFRERRSRLICQVNLQNLRRRRKVLGASHNFTSKYHTFPAHDSLDEKNDISNEVVDLVYEESKNKQLISRPLLAGLFRKIVIPALAVIFSHFFKAIIGVGRHLLLKVIL